MKANMTGRRTDTPMLSGLIGLALLISTPISLYILFTRWAESPQRQAAAAAGLLAIASFAILRKKLEALLLALVLFSQFDISLHSFPLDEPAKLQVVFTDLLFILFMFAGLERKESLKPDFVGWVFLALVLWESLVALFYSAHMHKSLLFVLWQTKYLLVYLILRNMRLDEIFARKFMSVAFVVLLVQGALAVAQQIIGGPLGLVVFGEQDASRLYFVEGGLRVSGTLGGTNALAGYLAMLLVTCLPFMFRRRNALWYLAYGVGMVALLLALSRAGWLSFMFGGAIATIGTLRAGIVRPTRIIMLCLVGLTAVAGGAALYSERVKDRFEDKAAVASAMGRVHQFSAAWPIIERYPVFGIGPGVTEYYGAWNENERYVRNKLPDVRLGNQPHNSQLQFWIESGTPAAALFVTVLVMVAVTAIRKRRLFPECPDHSALQIGAAAGALAAMVHASFGTEINNPQISMVFWILFALARNNSIERASARGMSKPLRAGTLAA